MTKMKIVTSKEFLAIKERVVYCTVDKYGNLSEPSIKHSPCGENCFFYINLNDQKDNDDIDSPLDFNSASRDGFFNTKTRYAVYSENDVENMIEALSKCLGSKL